MTPDGKGTAGGSAGWVLAVVFAGTFLTPLDSSIVNIALPTLVRHFRVGITSVEWVVVGYLLVTSSLLLTAGRIGDRFGHRRCYLAGFAIFTTGSALCGLAPTLLFLIAARIVQAVGGTFLLASGPALVTGAVPPDRRGRALGLIAISVSIGLTLGPFLGGLLTATWGWRWIFLVNLPLGIGVLMLGALKLPEMRSPSPRRFDIPGAVAGFLAFFLLLLGLSQGNDWGWRSPRTIGVLAGSLAATVLFLVLERRHPDPVLDLGLFRNRLFTAANASALANYFGLFIIIFSAPFLLMHVHGHSSRSAGLILTAIPLATALVSPAAGALSDRIGSRALSSAGLAMMALALLGLSRVAPTGGTLAMAGLLALAGFGSGIFQAPNTSAIMGSVPRERLGTASGMQAAMRNIGMAVGVAVTGAILATVAPGGAADRRFPAAVSLAYLVGVIVVGLGGWASLLRGSAPPRH